MDARARRILAEPPSISCRWIFPPPTKSRRARAFRAPQCDARARRGALARWRVAQVRGREFERLLAVIQQLSGARELRRIQEIVRTAARELTHADGATFILRDEDRCFYADEDAIEPLWKGRRFPMSACVSGWVMHERRAVAIPDIYADPRVPTDAYRPTFVRSMAMMPIRTDAPVGAIGVYWATERVPTDEEMKLLSALADSTSVAMENVRLFEELQAGLRERGEALVRAEHELAQRERAQDALRRTEEQLRHAQKMEAVGRLAGSIAHDFNNLLSVILSYATMIVDELAEDDPHRLELDEIRKAGERAARLTKQLLAFSRQQVLAPQVHDLDILLGGMENMLRRVVGEDVSLTVTRSERLDHVVVDAGQMEQVVMNLVINARDAMPRGGKLTIETRNVVLTDDYAETHYAATPGPYVMLAVSDTGHGMDRETQARIFEPFFTTKEVGKGTGLGLSTVYGIVHQSRGHVWVYSEPGVGTTFKVYLPRSEEQKASVPPPALPVARLSGHERVLLVEDDAQLRVVSREILTKYGYRVLEAGTAKEALALCEGLHEPLDLLLTDVVMPELSGVELASRLTVARPGVKVLFMSGYTDDAALRHGLIEPTMIFVQKPFTPSLLLTKVREVLDAE
ncbi:MAG: response regulator [Deltaproteobacteria bacterium]|nr:response regulator [Deltaproteobacteria bacterium]